VEARSSRDGRENRVGSTTATGGAKRCYSLLLVNAAWLVATDFEEPFLAGSRISGQMSGERSTVESDLQYNYSKSNRQMELTPDERQRIYLEEKARLEIRTQLRTEAPYQTLVPVAVQSRPSNGVAAVLSLFIPGAGQMYKGKVGQGIVWLICTIIGYIVFVIPGLVLHLICIFHAASMDPAQS